MLSTQESLAQFEENLSRTLIDQCTQRGALGGELLVPEELDEMWRLAAPQYMADAVSEFNDYPAVSIAWAAYVGMGVASLWDRQWDAHKDRLGLLYTEFRSVRGFDQLDEYVSEQVLGVAVDSESYNVISDLLLSLAQSTLSLMRGERIESGSTDAFYVFAAAAKVFFRIGVSVELCNAGYKYRKVKVAMPSSAMES